MDCSQLPEIVPLQRRLFEQIAGEKMSPAQEGSIEFQVGVLKKQALGQNIILILDDIWDKGQRTWYHHTPTQHFALRQITRPRSM